MWACRCMCHAHGSWERIGNVVCVLSDDSCWSSPAVLRMPRGAQHHPCELPAKQLHLKPAYKTDSSLQYFLIFNNVCLSQHRVLKPTSLEEPTHMKNSPILAMSRMPWDPARKWREEGWALFEQGKRKDGGWTGSAGAHPASWYRPAMPAQLN